MIAAARHSGRQRIPFIGYPPATGREPECRRAGMKIQKTGGGKKQFF